MARHCFCPVAFVAGSLLLLFSDFSALHLLLVLCYNGGAALVGTENSWGLKAGTGPVQVEGQTVPELP